MLCDSSVELRLFCLAEMDRHRDEHVVRDGPASRLGQILLVDDRPDQLAQHGLAAIGPCGRGAQPQAQGGQAVEGALVLDRSRQVVNLIVNDQPITVADLLHVNPGAIVGRHRDGPDFLPTIAEHAGVEAEACANAALPLVHQVAQRGHHQGGRPMLRHQGHGDFGLPGSGRLHHDTPAARPFPRIDRRLLIGPERR